jgi:riboflavin synthase
MFTGIVETMGRVARALDAEGARRVRIEAPAELLSSMEPGASVAVDGACLTAVSVDREGFEVDVVLSTLSRTIASAYEAGRHVNLERALILGERLDGHLVQGHVDGLGRLDAIEEAGETRFLTFRVPAPVHALTLLHGSITLNGVSLTVNRLDDPDLVQVAIIPHTWSHTNLGRLQPGDAVNVEGDLLGKYVGRILATRSAGPGGSGS